MNYISLIISVLIAQVAGVVGSVFTAQNVSSWYVEIVKPALNPPSWVFGPVWITLYTLMGVASYLVWQKRSVSNTKPALIMYGVQLVLNALWSILFFGLKSPSLAFVEIIILLLSIIITTVMFWKITSTAGALMIPYIIWVAFATYLNFAIWQLN